jgi:hypothetical protein
VCGARGSGKETSIGACDASPVAVVAAIMGSGERVCEAEMMME